MNVPNQSTVAIKPMLQIVFGVVVIGAFLAQNAQILYYLLQQLPSNTNLSSFLLIGVNAFFLPLIYLSLGYWAAAKKGSSKVSTLFMALLLMTIGTTLTGIMSVASVWLYSMLVLPGSGYWGTVVYDLAGGALALAVFVGIVVRLKRKGNI